MRVQSYLHLLFLFLLGCNAQQGTVDIKTNGIFIPITFGIDGENASGKNLDLGEWDRTEGPKVLTLTVRNNTLFNYTNISLDFSATDPLASSIVNYVPDETGETKFPGAGGTCGEILAPALTCTILVQMLAPIDGIYEEEFHLSFRNYVDFENHIAKVTLLAGLPAELVIEDSPSRITFGDLVGLDTIVERTEGKSYSKSYTVKNVGGLSARKLKINHTNVCTDIFSADCDNPDFENAYTIQSTCSDGINIRPQESCRFTVTYTPKNVELNVPMRFSRIRYTAATLLEFERNPRGKKGSIGINYQSLSTKIEGELSQISDVDMTNDDDGVIQGNQLSRIMRLSNKGTRSLKLRKVIFTKPKLNEEGDDLWAECLSEGTTTLSCYRPIGTREILPLSEFPLIVEDLESCFGDKDSGKFIDVDKGCLLKITFRPSSEVFFNPPASPSDFTETNYRLMEATKKVKAFIHYDSQWRGGENYCDEKILLNEPCLPLKDIYGENSYYYTNHFFALDLKRRSAAAIEVSEISYNNVVLTEVSNTNICDPLNPTDCNLEKNKSLSTELNSLSTFDHGRLPILSSRQGTILPNFKTLKIVFLNKGLANATVSSLYYLKNGLPQYIDLTGIKGSYLSDANNCVSGTNSNSCFYRDHVLTSDCTIITPGRSCTLQIAFAPFLLTGGLAGLESRAMFDYPFLQLDESRFYPPFKSFHLVYSNSSLLRDDGSPFPELTTEARIRATLTREGKIAEMKDVIDDEFKNVETISNSPNGIVRGADVDFNLYLTNIGSAPVTQITPKLLGAAFKYSKEKVCGLPGGVNDCRCYDPPLNPVMCDPLDNSQVCFDIKVNSCTSSDCDASNLPVIERIACTSTSPQKQCYIPKATTCTDSEVWTPEYANTIPDVLLPDKTCYIPLRWENPLDALATESPNSSAIEQLGRVNYASYASTATSFILSNNITFLNCFKHTASETRSPGYNERLGYSKSIPEFKTTVSSVKNPARLVPTFNNTGTPWHTAAIMRFPMSLETASYANRFFYWVDGLGDPLSIDLSQSGPAKNFPLENVFLNPVFDNRSYVSSKQGNLTGFLPEDNTIRYYLFLGYHPKFTLPLSSTVDVTFSLRNIGSANGRVMNTSIEEIGGYLPLSITLDNKSFVNSSNLDVTINQAGSKPLLARMNPALCSSGKCTYAMKLNLTYDTGKRDIVQNGTGWSETCDESNDQECKRNIELFVFGEIHADTTPPVSLSQSDIPVTFVNQDLSTESCNGVTSSLQPITINSRNDGGSWNQFDNMNNALYMEAPLTNSKDFRKKLFKLTNTSSDDLTLSLVQMRLSGSQKAETQQTVVENPTCTDIDSEIQNNLCRSNMTLTANGGYCYTAVRYKPTSGTPTQRPLSFVLFNTNNSGHNFIFNQPINFDPIPPADVVPVLANGTEYGTNQVNLSTGVTSAYKLNNTSQGTFYFQEVPYRVRSFYQRLKNKITNGNGVVRASFLAEWRSQSPDKANSVPGESDFVTDNSSPNPNATRFTLIKTVGDTLKIYASKDCIYGTFDIGSTSPSAGFNSSNNDCYLRYDVTFGHNNMLHRFLPNIKGNVNPYYASIKYYNSGRTTPTEMKLFVELNIRPKLYDGNNRIWGTISATSSRVGTTDSKTANLTFPVFVDTGSESIGDIVGYRIYRARTLNDLYVSTSTDPLILPSNGVYRTGRSKDFTYQDYIITDPSDFTKSEISRTLTFTADLSRFYFYRIFLIRAHNSFSLGTTMFGLANPRHFITEITNFKEETIWSPQTGWIYDHNLRLAVARSNSTSKPSAYTNCSGSLAITREGATKYPVRSLINRDAWNILPSVDKGTPQWIFSTSLYAFSSVCPELGNKLADSVTDPICRRTATTVNGGREVRGAGATCFVNNSQAYIEQSTFFACGHIRCMVDLKCCYPDMRTNPICNRNSCL